MEQMKCEQVNVLIHMIQKKCETKLNVVYLEA